MSDTKTESFYLGLGSGVGITTPQHGFKARVKVSRKKLLAMLTEHQPRSAKNGPYITRPMGGDGSRSDANAEPWSIVPTDVDELDENEVPLLLRWCEESRLACVIVTTYSHRKGKPKYRIFFFTDRPVLASEHAFAHRALSQRVPFKLDPCMEKPSQPIFLASCPPEYISDAYAKVLPGDLLRTDLLLAGCRAEMEEEQRRKAERISGAATGVRQPGGLIEYFNSNFDLGAFLEKHKYRRKGRNRFVAPSSRSGRAAVVLYAHGVVSFHDPGHCLLAVRNKSMQAVVLDAFAVFCKLEHADDFKKAFKGAAKWAQLHGWEDSIAAPTIRRPKQADALMQITFAALIWIIADLLPEGCFLLAARPKIGKSWLALQFAVAVILGLLALGKQAALGSVLYLALEDNERRLQSRLAKYQDDHQGNTKNLYYETQWERIGEGGAEAIEAWLIEHPDARLVIVDTLEKIRPQRVRNGSVYADDYEATQALKKLSDKYKVAVLIVAHNKKGKSESGDPLELISGSLGLSGGCDGALVIERPRGQTDAKFYVIGRDIEHEPDDGYVIRFNKATCKWEMVGDAAALNTSKAQQSVIDAIVHAGHPLSAKQVGDATKRGRQAALHILSRLVDAGRLVRIDGKPVQFDLPSGGQSDAGDTDDD